MSMQPKTPGEIPPDTVRVARAAFPKGSLAIRVRDELGPLFKDEEFSDLYPARGKPAWSPGRLALVLVLQFVEGLTDRQAAEAVRARIDFKYALVRHEAPSLRARVRDPCRWSVAADQRSWGQPDRGDAREGGKQP